MLISVLVYCFLYLLVCLFFDIICLLFVIVIDNLQIIIPSLFLLSVFFSSLSFMRCVCVLSLFHLLVCLFSFF